MEKTSPMPGEPQTNGAPQEPYDAAFFASIGARTLRSARQVCPLVLSFFPVKSVVDVGCGEGNWLRAFLENGVPQVLGIDGDYVDRSRLMIPQERFLSRDLTKAIPADVGRFDLAVSLEVAEHLSSDCAGQFVASLAALSDMVLFSAAIPGQGGTHHVNEQWPSYWKELFQERGYIMVDCLREQIWDNSDIEAYYRQNLFLCLRKEALPSVPALQRFVDRPVRDLIHPVYWGHDTNLRSAWMLFRTAALAEVKRRLGIKGSFRSVLFR